MSAANAKLPPGNAVAYVRMSTEHQQYSTSNQMDVVREYAKRRGFEIVKIYSDGRTRPSASAMRPAWISRTWTRSPLMNSLP